MFCGKPLISWSIEAALSSSLMNDVVVSTDDPEIAVIARNAGAQVPFMRPVEFAQDDSPGVDPVLHALDQLPQYEFVMMLQPTSPLRNSRDIDACLRLFEERRARSVVSICETNVHPHWLYRLNADQSLTRFLLDATNEPRQKLPKAYAVNGAIYLVDVKWLREHSAFVGPETISYVMPATRSADIDTQLQWDVAEFMMHSCLGEE
jgi:CMP-N,N'-diacetyllegionaminic acid synthase